MNKGKLIVVEGPDGCGKSVAANNIVSKLESLGIRVFYTREPGGTDLGSRLRDIILHSEMSPISQAFLALASRIQHQDKFLRPMLEAGTWVVCDRYTYSTLAYQFAGGLGLKKYEAPQSNAHAFEIAGNVQAQMQTLSRPEAELINAAEVCVHMVDSMLPADKVFVFNAPVAQTSARVDAREDGKDVFESESQEYKTRVSKAYAAIVGYAKKPFGPEKEEVKTKFVEIDASKSLTEMILDVNREVEEYVNSVKIS